MTEPNNFENTAAEELGTDVDAATAATEEFNYTIGDAIAPEVDATEETVEVAPLHEGPIQTVGRRKRAIARVTTSTPPNPQHPKWKPPSGTSSTPAKPSPPPHPAP